MPLILISMLDSKFLMLLKQEYNIEAILSITSTCCIHVYFIYFCWRSGEKVEASAKSPFVLFAGVKEQLQIILLASIIINYYS